MVAGPNMSGVGREDVMMEEEQDRQRGRAGVEVQGETIEKEAKNEKLN